MVLAVWLTHPGEDKSDAGYCRRQVTDRVEDCLLDLIIIGIAGGSQDTAGQVIVQEGFPDNIAQKHVRKNDGLP